MTQLSGQTIVDPSHDLRVPEVNPLQYIFHSKAVAVIGATEKEGSVGRTVLWNLISNPFGGTVYPVNPKRNQVLGIHAYPTVKDVPIELDLAVICTAAKVVPGAVKECVEANVKGIVIISAGFKEMGAAGEKLEAEITEYVRGTNIRIIGPNCLGVMSPFSGLNATFGADMARPGNVAFISQSGALCTAILDWSIAEQVGFSAFVSIGSMLDVNWGDLITYFGDDPKTGAIVIYMESVGNARAFLSAAREVALTKPIIILKAGRTEAAAKAAASHTGSLTGSDAVLDAAFRRVGVMRVDKIADLFAMAELLAKQPLPKGNRLTILTNAGGPGVLAADELVQGGGCLTELSKETFEALNALLPPHWSRNNPVDVLGDATPQIYAKSLEIAAADHSANGLLVILTPQDMTNPTQTAEALAPYAKSLGKPVIASWMGGPRVKAGCEVLQRAAIPTFEHPDDACRAFNMLWQYSANLDALYQTPSIADDPNVFAKGAQEAKKIITAAQAEKRTLLNEYESKKLLQAYGIPTVATEIATSKEEAAQLASQMGFPIVLKLFSATITHKTDVGGVKLNLRSEDDVRNAYTEIEESVTQKAGREHFQGVTVQPMIKLKGHEVILGSSLDSQFGPVLLFGAGGQLVEVFKDSSLGLPPLTATLAQRMMEKTKIFKALKGVRGEKSADIDALSQLMVRFSHLVSQEHWIAEIDINPLLVSPEQIIALDARVVLQDTATPVKKLPEPAIRPYPVQYISKVHTKSGRELLIRPIRAEDEALLTQFHRSLSEQTVLNRYHRNYHYDERVSHQRLVRICFSDYSRELALVALNKTDREEIAGVCRLSRQGHNLNYAEFSLLVADPYQGQGLGRALLTRAIEVAKEEKILQIGAKILNSNEAGIALCRSLGFAVITLPDVDQCRVELKIG